MPDLRMLLEELNSGDDERAVVAAGRIAESGDAALPAVAALLDAPQSERRWWAVRTLAEMRDPPIDWLTRAIGDSSPDVRAAAALALAAHPAELAAPALVSGLGDADGLVGVLCVSALTAIGGLAVPALLQAFDDAAPRAQIQIMRALAEISDPRAIGLMLKATELDSAVLGYWAHQGLERLGLDMVYLKME